MLDKQLCARLENVFSRLSVSVKIWERNSVKPVDVSALSAGSIREIRGYLCYAINQPPMVLAIPADTPGGENLLALAAALASRGNGGRRMENANDAYRLIMEENLEGPALESAARDFQISKVQPRCVLVLKMMQASTQTAMNALSEVIPVQDSDVLVEMDSRSLALIKDMTDEDSLEDVLQYANALQETFDGDTLFTVKIGVGKRFSRLEELAQSFREAREALKLGSAFAPKQGVLVYEQLLLERLLSEIEPEIRQRYHKLLSERISDTRLFNEEMHTTIDTFLDADLNVAEASRRLYTHRNTLVYRLNSIQRVTGLDLRSFRDAMTFRILMDLGKA